MNATIVNVQNLRCILLIFEADLGLKVNLKKSKLIWVGNVSNLLELAAMLGCEMEEFLITYLGLPLGARYKVKSIWDPLIPFIERVERRLSSWKGKYLSKGGKFTLVQSVLSSFPVYFLSLFFARSSMI